LTRRRTRVRVVGQGDRRTEGVCALQLRTRLRAQDARVECYSRLRRVGAEWRLPVLLLPHISRSQRLGEALSKSICRPDQHGGSPSTGIVGSQNSSSDACRPGEWRRNSFFDIASGLLVDLVHATVRVPTDRSRRQTVWRGEKLEGDPHAPTNRKSGKWQREKARTRTCDRNGVWPRRPCSLRGDEPPGASNQQTKPCPARVACSGGKRGSWDSSRGPGAPKIASI